MVLIKKTLGNENTLNHDLHVQKLKCDELEANTFVLAPNSIHPSAIQPGMTVDQFTKLKEISGDIVDTGRTQTIDGSKKFLSSVTIESSTANEFETLHLINTSVTGSDACGLSFQNNTGVSKRGLYKSNVLDQLCFFKEGTVEVCIDNNVELKVAGSKYKINGNDVLSETTLGPSVVNSSITSFGNLQSLTIENTNANLTLNSTSTGCNLNLFNGDKRINFDSAFNIFHSSTNPTILDIRNNAGNSIIRFNNQFSTCAIGTNANSSLSNTVLNIDSSLGTKGLLLPFIDNTQKGSLAPSEGLMFYNESNKDIEFYDGTGWKSIGLHNADVSTVHGLSSDIMGINETQNVTNKTFHGQTIFENLLDSDNFSMLSINNNFNRSVGLRFKNNITAALNEEVGIYMDTTQKLCTYQYNQVNIQLDKSVNLLRPDGDFRINGAVLLDSTSTLVANNKKDDYKLLSANGLTEFVTVSSAGTDIKNGLFIGGFALQQAYKNNMTAIIDPGTDNTYDIGSHWLNTITDKYFVCVEKTPAVWKEIAYQESLTGYVGLTGDETIGGFKTFSSQTSFSEVGKGLVVRPATGNSEIEMHKLDDGTKINLKTISGKFEIYDSTALVDKSIVQASTTSFDLINGNYHQAGNRVVFKNNYSAVTDPLITSDTNSDYSVGSMWINNVTGVKYSCMDNTAGSARWYETRSENITFQEYVGNSATYFTVVSWIVGKKKYNSFDVIITPGSAVMDVRIYNLSTASVEAEHLTISGPAQIVTLPATTPYYTSGLETLQLQLRKASGGGSITCQALRIR